MRTGPNKTCAWRKTKRQLNTETNKVERYGRRFRNAMMMVREHKATILPIHVWLFKAGGVATPVFDNMIKSMHNDSIDTEKEEHAA